MKNSKFTHNISNQFCNRLNGSLFLILAVALNLRGYTQPVATVKEMSEIFDRQTSTVVRSDDEFSVESLLPDPDKLVKEGTTNGLRLDSVYEDKYYAYHLEKRKWLYHYNNNRLFSLEHFYFYDSYDEQLDLREIWYYNEMGKVLEYEEKDKPVSFLDSFFVESNDKYIYEENVLILKISTILSRLSYGSAIVNGEVIQHYETQYSSDTTHYWYNENNLLIEENGGSIVKYYSYNSLDQLKIKMVRDPYYLAVWKYNYEETDSAKIIIRKFVYLGNETDTAAIDTVTAWGSEFYSYHVLDRLGRDSVQINYYTSSDYRFKTCYQYLQSGEISFVSIYYTDMREKQETWVEQARIEYTYNEYGNLLEYHRMFYDESVPGWKTENLKTYYYSSHQGTVTGDLKAAPVSIYPNPATNYITVKNLSKDGLSYRVFNSMGQVILAGKLEDAVIPVSFLQSGVYILQLRNESSTTIQRFIKH